MLQKCVSDYQIDPADVDETLDDTLDTPSAIRELALRKAESVLKRHPNAVVIGADTAVIADDEIMGKPKNDADACRMLKKLQGRTHKVITGLSIVSLKHKYTDVSISYVTFCEMSNAEIREYIATGECLDKAGAYAVQGTGSRYITHIEGDFYAVMGLPVHLVYEELRHLSQY